MQGVAKWRLHEFWVFENELSRMYEARDPSYKGAASYIKPEEYDKLFNPQKKTQ